MNIDRGFKMNVQGKSYEVIYAFDVMFVGWECDPKGWVVKDSDGVKYAVLTNHGTPYIAEPIELRRMISEYEQVIEQTNKALQILNQE